MSLLKPDLRDCWIRFDWAQDDCETLNALLHQLPETDTYSTWVRPQGDRWHARFRCLVDPLTEAQRLNPIARSLGSVFDNARSSLNYLAYQIALLALKEDPSLDIHPDAVEFPIFNDPEMFRRHNRVKKLSDGLRLRIEAVQPYHGTFPGLWILHELGREYRHRVIHPVAVFPIGDHHGIFRESVNAAISDLEIAYEGGVLQDGDELFSFAVSADDFQPNIAPPIQITVGIDHPLCRGKTLIGVLQTIMDDVVGVLNGWVADFPGAGPDWELIRI